jgi:hypothetical protein
MSLTVRTRDPMSAAAPEPTDRDVVKSFISGTESESGAGGVTGRIGMIIPPSPLPVMVDFEPRCVGVKVVKRKVKRWMF